MNVSAHEIEFIKSFIKKEKQKRYLDFITSKSKKSQRKFFESLNHKIENEIESKYISNQKDIEFLLTNNSPCYLISDKSDYNQIELSQENALAIILKIHFGAIISFIPGKLACFKAESPSDIIWLMKL